MKVVLREQMVGRTMEKQKDFKIQRELEKVNLEKA